MRRSLTAIVLFLALVCEGGPDAARSLARRVLPRHADLFAFETIPADKGRDVFEIESRDGKVVVRGNNGVSMATGLNWYLKHHAHCNVSWCGTQLNLPDPLPLCSRRYAR